MLCPQDPKKEWDDLICQDCNFFMQCFKMWQGGNIWGKEVKSVPDILKDYHKVHDEPIGDNYPKMEIGKSYPVKSDLLQEIVEIARMRKEPKINQNDIDDLKLDLELFGRKNDLQIM